MLFNHSSGILMHITSLPGPYGAGDLGPSSYAWLDFLKSARTRWWQVLPLGPTGYGDSPYQSYSSFAGNPNLISPELLHQDGLIDEDHLHKRPDFPTERVDFTNLIDWKRGLFQVAFVRTESMPALRAEFAAFREQQAAWLDEFALFMTLKAQHDLRPWSQWAPELRDREPAALARIKKDHASTISYFAFQQFLFFRQWSALRERMRAADVQLIGDLPIYVAPDSADIWCQRDLFEVEADGRLTRVAGVPPDMFSDTGQLWGNPLYRWDALAKQGFTWWLERLRGVLGIVDVLRLDHFRGFANYYAIPGEDKTAEHGTWELGPGEAFFETVNAKVGGLPLIAEDLGGEGEPLVVNLRDKYNLPGMKLFQFGFDEDMNHKFLPHNYPENCVAYTGTHDNDTTVGWFSKAPEAERKFCLEYVGSDGKHIALEMLRKLWASPADLVVAPLQDFLELGSEARMNRPGTALGNWDWRVDGDLLTEQLAERIRAMNSKAKRAS